MATHSAQQVIQCMERFSDLEKIMGVTIAQHDGRIKVTETGIANFRYFTSEQRDVNSEVHDFIVRSGQNEINDKAFHDRRDKETSDALNKQADSVKDALDDHERKALASDRKFKRALAIAMLIISIYMGWMTWRDYERKVSVANPPTVSYSNPPQNVLNKSPF